MNARQRRMLERIFAQPAPAEIPWSDILSLFDAPGATVQRRAGSRAAVRFNDYVAALHEPHPERKARRLPIRDVRASLERTGVTP
jgi:hypothetical protein